MIGTEELQRDTTELQRDRGYGTQVKTDHSKDQGNPVVHEIGSREDQGNTVARGPNLPKVETSIPQSTRRQQSYRETPWY